MVWILDVDGHRFSSHLETRCTSSFKAQQHTSRKTMLLFPFLNKPSDTQVLYDLRLILWPANYQPWGLFQLRAPAAAGIDGAAIRSNQVRSTCSVAPNAALSTWYLTLNPFKQSVSKHYSSAVPGKNFYWSIFVASPFDNGYGLSRKYTLWAARAHLRTFFVLQPGVKVLATASRLNKISILKHQLFPLKRRNKDHGFVLATWSNGHI